MKSASALRLLFALNIALTAGIVAHARPVAACGNEVERDTDVKVQHMLLAEQALGAGKATAAAEAALKDYPKLHAAPRLMQGGWPSTGLDRVGVRAQRVAAVALVRTEGLLTTTDEFHAGTADERRANLEWSIAILRAIVSLMKTPAAETDLGEALSKLSETRDEALSILDRLDKKDLLTTPQGYAALIELRQATGDTAGREAAQKRLDSMTRSKAPGGLAKSKG